MRENLYCPRCGTHSGNETSYCRICGLSLAGVGEIVNGDAQNAPITSTRPNPKAIRLGIGLFIFSNVLGLTNAMLRDFELFPERYGKVVFLSFLIVGLACIATAFLFPSIKYTKRKYPDSTTNSDSATQFDTNPLPDQLLPPSPPDLEINIPSRVRERVRVSSGSVTEHTTRQLRSGDRSD